LALVGLVANVHVPASSRYAVPAVRAIALTVVLVASGITAAEMSGDSDASGGYGRSDDGGDGVAGAPTKSSPPGDTAEAPPATSDTATSDTATKGQPTNRSDAGSGNDAPRNDAPRNDAPRNDGAADPQPNAMPDPFGDPGAPASGP